MKTARFLFFIFILGSLIISGCLREYENIEITSVDVMSSQQDDGTKLTITPYIQNNQNKDTRALTLKVKIREPGTNIIVAEKDSDIGYIKSKSTSYNSIILTITDPGEYGIEVQLFEGGSIVSQNYVPVTVKPRPGPGQPSRIKLTDMNLIVTKIYSDATGAFVDVSPGIYNDGGDSKPLTMEVTARVDQYTAYIKADELGIVKGMSSARGKVSFDIPRNREYIFTVNVIENGKTVASGKVSEKIKLNEIKYNTPMTYVLIEEGKPRVTAVATPPKEPGFEIAIALISMLLVYDFIIRRRRYE